MKKSFCLLLTMVMLFALAVPAFAATPEVAVPYYANATNARASLSISSNGTATIALYCLGKSGCKSIVCTSYLEQKVGSSWVRVDIEETNDQWIDSVSTMILNKTHTCQLDTRGTYRLTANFVVTVSSSETISFTQEATY